MTDKQVKILATYNMYDDDDISTERLLAIVCDTCKCEIEDIIEVLRLDGRIKNEN